MFSGATISREAEALLRLMFRKRDFTSPAGRERLANALRFYVDEAMKAAPGGGLFGETRASPFPSSSWQRTGRMARDDRDKPNSSPAQGPLSLLARTHRELGQSAPDSAERTYRNLTAARLNSLK